MNHRRKTRCLLAREASLLALLLSTKRLTRLLGGCRVSRGETDHGHMPQVSLHSSSQTRRMQASERGDARDAALHP